MVRVHDWGKVINLYLRLGTRLLDPHCQGKSRLGSVSLSLNILMCALGLHVHLSADSDNNSALIITILLPRLRGHYLLVALYVNTNIIIDINRKYGERILMSIAK